jgi:hypothetical protein
LASAVGSAAGGMFCERAVQEMAIRLEQIIKVTALAFALLRNEFFN